MVQVVMKYLPICSVESRVVVMAQVVIKYIRLNNNNNINSQRYLKVREMWLISMRCYV